MLEGAALSAAGQQLLAPVELPDGGWRRDSTGGFGHHGSPLPEQSDRARVSPCASVHEGCCVHGCCRCQTAPLHGTVSWGPRARTDFVLHHYNAQCGFPKPHSCLLGVFSPCTASCPVPHLPPGQQHLLWRCPPPDSSSMARAPPHP